MKRKNTNETTQETPVPAKKRTHKARIITLIVVAVLAATFILAYAFAYTIPEEEVQQAIELVQKNDVAVLQPGDVLGDPDWVPEFEPSLAPWEASDTERILFLDLNDSNFEAVAKAYEGLEIVKCQECKITAINGDMLECVSPDGSIYEVSHTQGLTVGEVVAVYFLLSAV